MTHTLNNIKYRLGKNAKDNWKLIDDADPDDWWVHLDDHPSAHCIIEIKDITTDMIRFAGELIKQKSKLKNEKKLNIVYTQIKYIKKTKIVGQVVLSQKYNISLI